MICPACEVQMHQHRKAGGGQSQEDYYDTWTIQECPACGALYKEYYSCEKLTKEIDDEEIDS